LKENVLRTLPPNSSWNPEIQRRAAKTLSRLLPRLEQRFAGQMEGDPWDAYSRRLQRHFPSLFAALTDLYGDLYDFFFHVEAILISTTQMWLERPDSLKALDALREADPRWFQSNRMVGATCYVDLFAGNLAGLREKVPYLKELGITYLHLMPLFQSPEGDNDGGYAVSNFRELDPSVGTMQELAELTHVLRYHGISLVLDFVLNHTSDEHEWARRASLGDPEYLEYYRVFDNRQLPDTYDLSMGDVFPDDHQGAFTYRSEMRKWVWTTFHNYQWDLNYENPVVLNRMIEEMLFLANQGVEVLRFDAVAFLWKQLGTDCQNLPQAHAVIRAFSAIAKIVAPAVVLKSEAIVHPEEVRKYISYDECQLSYNPELMALLWNSLATREVKLLREALIHRFQIPEECDWVNYVRCHDDIGWAFSDEDVAGVGFGPAEHRRFLTDFYTGRFPGSFARGLPFQENPRTGDARVSGMTASLVGLEKALAEHHSEDVELSIRRILLIHGIIMTIGGIPLLYLGDEIATPNDYGYQHLVSKGNDSRWVHRPKFDWSRADRRHDRSTPEGRVFAGILHLIQLRQQNLAFSRSSTEIIDTGNEHVFGFFRNHDEHSVLVLANFSESPQQIEGRHLRKLGLRRSVVDMVAGDIVTATHSLEMGGYQLMLLSRFRK
jgi:amylosucrase/maltose alpha-D-glucosyltransferase/alpha-amylase